MGNIELHLILGVPYVPSDDDVVVSHIAFESKNISEVLKGLREMNIPFETSMTILKGDKEDGFITQYFLRDPDGYYVEVCTCEKPNSKFFFDEETIMSSLS